MIQDQVKEYIVFQSNYRQLFAMDWVNNLHLKEEGDLSAILAHFLVAAEQGVEKLTLEQMTVNLQTEVKEKTEPDEDVKPPNEFPNPLQRIEEYCNVHCTGE